MYIKKNYQQFRYWLQTDLGNYIKKQQYSVLADIVNDILVRNLLVVGEEDLSLTTGELLTDRNKKIQQVILHPCVEFDINLQDRVPSSVLLVARQDKIPIATDSVDAVVLPHTLEMVDNPHEVLREAHRVLRPNGKIIIAGFKCGSVWGIWRWLARIFQCSPWQNHFISIGKLKDWLALLGFDELKAVDYCYNLPVNNQKLLTKLSGLEKIGDLLPFVPGNIYTIAACKRIIPLSKIFANSLVNLPIKDELPGHSFDG